MRAAGSCRDGLTHARPTAQPMARQPQRLRVPLGLQRHRFDALVCPHRRRHLFWLPRQRLDSRPRPAATHQAPPMAKGGRPHCPGLTASRRPYGASLLPSAAPTPTNPNPWNRSPNDSGPLIQRSGTRSASAPRCLGTSPRPCSSGPMRKAAACRTWWPMSSSAPCSSAVADPHPQPWGRLPVGLKPHHTPTNQHP